ncbi:hypothetical protein AB0B10_26800 [Micromonospora arborensis]|uniref:hypothetical protein n=1 Tax=Micromonospora arborensis TaxID=2116518 RepID=UPI0033BFDDA1
MLEPPTQGQPELPDLRSLVDEPGRLAKETADRDGSVRDVDLCLCICVIDPRHGRAARDNEAVRMKTLPRTPV